MGGDWHMPHLRKYLAEQGEPAYACVLHWHWPPPCLPLGTAAARPDLPALSRPPFLEPSGANFTSYITDFALCCPSRTTILTGQCSHNTGVRVQGCQRRLPARPAAASPA